MPKERLIVEIQFFLQMKYLIYDLLIKDAVLLVIKAQSCITGYQVAQSYEAFVLLLDFVRSTSAFQIHTC